MTDVSMQIAKINVREYIVYPSLIAVLRIFWICHLLFVCLLVTEAYFDSLCGMCDAKVGRKWWNFRGPLKVTDQIRDFFSQRHKIDRNERTSREETQFVSKMIQHREVFEVFCPELVLKSKFDTLDRRKASHSQELFLQIAFFFEFLSKKS